MKGDADRELLTETSDQLQLSITGCPSGYELDSVPRDEVLSIMVGCTGMGFEEADVATMAAADVPNLLRCELITTLTSGQQIAMLTLVRHGTVAYV